MLIRAADVRAHEQPFVIEDVELDDTRPHEAVVRLISFGLYHTDLVTRDGYYTIPCHVYLDTKGRASSRQ